jgi:hypothetical protein
LMPISLIRTRATTSPQAPSPGAAGSFFGQELAGGFAPKHEPAPRDWEKLAR